MGIGFGMSVLYLSLIVFLPLALVVWHSADGGFSSFWDSVTAPVAWSALKFTILMALLVAVVNAVMGTLIAWVLVRDSFRGQRVVDALIDLPFALPTIVAGLVLVALYGPTS
ncbi:MAG: sulfate transporter, inner rane subunit CysT, partial [Acidimicrobiia bacterium]|nr:sulfate transporter, inner rane subunit CysT [Acidimicrobiia bacterium]